MLGSNLEKGIQALKSSQLVREGRPRPYPAHGILELSSNVGSYGLADREGPGREVIARN